MRRSMRGALSGGSSGASAAPEDGATAGGGVPEGWPALQPKQASRSAVPGRGNKLSGLMWGERTDQAQKRAKKSAGQDRDPFGAARGTGASWPIRPLSSSSWKPLVVGTGGPQKVSTIGAFGGWNGSRFD